ncbi:MAG: hypothetical protein RLY16_1805 [Bacteroidota bacterium]|jgi:cytidine deaminase
MKIKAINLEVEVYASENELAAADASLLEKARQITRQAYAPYSNFHVGAAAVLENGEVVYGTNQENASYPVSICAERVLLGNAAMIFPDKAIITLAISYHNLNGKSDFPISPCGMCRQALSEYEERVKHPIRIILSGLTGEIYIIERADQLLPLTFTSMDLKG